MYIGPVIVNSPSVIRSTRPATSSGFPASPIAGIDPRSKRYLLLKSRIHYRAGFKPIASHVVECAGTGVTNADLTVYPYRKLTRPIFPLDPM